MKGKSIIEYSFQRGNVTDCKHF